MEYLDKREIIDFNEIVNSKYNFYAHKKSVGNKDEYEKLINHIDLLGFLLYSAKSNKASISLIIIALFPCKFIIPVLSNLDSFLLTVSLVTPQ